MDDRRTVIRKFEVMKNLLTNKYIISLLIFAVWMLFFDQNSFISQQKLSSELNQLEARKNFYQKQNQVLRIQKDELLTSDANMERLAREKYLMKKDDEDIFIINPEN